MFLLLIIAWNGKESQMLDEGNIFELIAEECYCDDKWEEENE